MSEVPLITKQNTDEYKNINNIILPTSLPEKEDINTEHFAMKFSFPRKQIENNFNSKETTLMEIIQRHCARNYPGTELYNQYNEYLEKMMEQLHSQKRKRAMKKKKNEFDVVCNYVHSNKPLRHVNFLVNGDLMCAMLDTGSSHSLVHKDSIKNIPKKSYKFTPLSLNMISAGGTLTNNIIGSAKLTMEFVTQKGSIMTIKHNFLICQILSFPMIIGDDFLTSQEFTPNLTPSTMFLYDKKTKMYQGIDIMSKSSQSSQERIGFVDKNITLEAKKTTPINIIFDYKINDHNTIYIDNLSSNKNVLVEPCLQNYNIQQNNTATSQIYVCNNTSEDIQLTKLSPICNIKFISKNNEISTDPETFLTYITQEAYKNECVHVHNNHIEMENKEWQELDGIEQANLKNVINNHPSTYLEDNIDNNDIFETQAILEFTKENEKLTYKDCDFSECSNAEKTYLGNIFKEYSETFAKHKLDIGKTNLIKHHLDIDKTKKIISQKQRFIPEHKLKAAQKIIDQYLEAGVIVRCDHPKLRSNIVLIPKGTDKTRSGKYHNREVINNETKFRICVDHRLLNEVILDKQPPNTIPLENIIEKMRNKHISVIDICGAYHNVELTKESIPYTAFYLLDKTYAFSRSVQGLVSSPKIWSDLVQIMFMKEVFIEARSTLTEIEIKLLDTYYKDYFDFLIGFVDDIFMFTEKENFALHAVCLKMMFYALRRAGVKINPAKCKFYAYKVKVLGIAFNSEDSEIFLDTIKADAIISQPRPVNLADLQSRLYSLQYYNKFLPTIKGTLAPFFIMLRTKQFTWDDTLEECWNTLKALIIADVRLTVPKPSDQLIIISDASLVSCSQLLFVIDENHTFKIVSCNSRIFNTNDSKKSMHLKETISLCLAFKQFFSYLSASEKPAIVLTDARNLIRLNKERERKILSSSLANFFANLALHVHFNVYHIPSVLNILPDLYSRAFTNSRFIQNGKYNLSKEAAAKLPPLNFPFQIDSNTLRTYFNAEIQPDLKDKGDKSFSKPKTLTAVYKLYQQRPPEFAYTDALLMLKQITNKISQYETKSIQHNLNIINNQSKDIIYNLDTNEQPPKDHINTLHPDIKDNPYLITKDPSIKPHAEQTTENVEKEYSLPSLSDNLHKSIAHKYDEIDITEFFDLHDKKGTMTEKEFNIEKTKIFRKIINDVIIMTLGQDIEKQQLTKIRNSLLENALKMDKINKMRQNNIIPSSMKNGSDVILKYINSNYQEVEQAKMDNIFEQLNDIVIEKEEFLNITWDKELKRIENEIVNLFIDAENNEECNDKLNNDGIKDHSSDKVGSTNMNSSLDSPIKENTMETIIKYQTNGPFPPQVNAGSNGIDLFFQQEYIIPPDQIMKVSTGTYLEIPEQYVGIIYTRSGIAMTGLAIINGVIDGNFRGEIQIIMRNLTNKDYHIIKGRSYVQIILHSTLIPRLVNEPISLISARGSRGFGSSNYNIQLQEDKTISAQKYKYINNILCHHLETENEDIDIITDQIDDLTCIENVRDSNKDLIDSSLNFIKKYFLPSKERNNHEKGSNTQKQAKEQAINEYLKFQTYKLGIISTDIIVDNKINKQNFVALQNSDEIFYPIRYQLRNNKEVKKYEIKNDLLYKVLYIENEKKYFLCIPTLLLPAFIYSIHQSLNHPSANQTLLHFRRHFYHPFSTRVIKILNNSCITCKVSTNVRPFHYKTDTSSRSVKARYARMVFAVDIIPSLPISNGYNNVLVVVDEFSNYTILVPLKTKTTQEIYTALHNIITFTGYIPYIRTDLEVALVMALKKLQKIIPFNLLSSTSYVHKQNSLAEKGVKAFKEQVTKMLYSLTKPEEKTSWYHYLPIIAHTINNGVLNKINLTRYELFYSITSPQLLKINEDFFQPEPIDLTKHKQIIDKITEIKQNFEHPFRQGDIVVLKQEQVSRDQSKTFSSQYIPSLFKIIKTTKGPDIILLNLKSGQKVHTRIDKIQVLKNLEFSAITSRLEFDSELLDETKRTTKTNTIPILEEIPFVIPYNEDMNIDNISEKTNNEGMQLEEQFTYNTPRPPDNVKPVNESRINKATRIQPPRKVKFA